jgi:hypothetical protein
MSVVSVTARTLILLGLRWKLSEGGTLGGTTNPSRSLKSPQDTGI